MFLSLNPALTRLNMREFLSKYTFTSSQDTLPVALGGTYAEPFQVEDLLDAKPFQ